MSQREQQLTDQRRASQQQHHANQYQQRLPIQHQVLNQHQYLHYVSLRLFNNTLKNCPLLTFQNSTTALKIRRL